MTIKQLYEWALANNAQNFDIGTVNQDSLEVDWFTEKKSFHEQARNGGYYFSMKAVKKGADLFFTLDDGKTVSYNLNTGECIGRNGKPCMYLNSQLKGYSIHAIADSFEDKNFGRFLLHVASSCRKGSTEIQNIGTVFQRLDKYRKEEQIFSAGLTLYSSYGDYYKGTINEIPKGLVKILREVNVGVGNLVIREYKAHPDAFNYAFNHEFVSIDKRNAFHIVNALKQEWNPEIHHYEWINQFFKVCDLYGYTPKSLLNYLDYLATYEAINLESPTQILGDIADNCNMLSKMSDKYDKYPRHFLSSHQITSRTYSRFKKEFPEELFAKCVKPKMETTIGEYKFIYPKTTADIKQEAVMQSNCVASYIDRVIDGRCDVVFMRYKDKPDESLVTVEVCGSKVVQARQRFNESVSDSQQKALSKYNEFLGKLNNPIDKP